MLEELKHIKKSYLFWDKEYLDGKNYLKKLIDNVFSLQHMRAFLVAIFLHGVSAMSLKSLEIQASSITKQRTL